MDPSTKSRRQSFEGLRGSGATKLYRQAIDQAVPEVLVEGRGMFLFRLTPDGTRILYVDGFNSRDPAQRQRVMRAPLQGGSPQVELNPWPPWNIDWAPDGKSVFVSSQTANGAPVILGVEPNGNHRMLLEGDTAARFWWVIPSPDGRYAALEEVTGANNVWMVENF